MSKESDFVDLLNKEMYELKISDLEAKLAESEADKKALISDYESRITKHQELMSWLEHDNGQLKQQLHELPKKIVEEIQENFDWRQCCEIRKYYDQQYIWFNYIIFNDFLHTILKKYGGEDE